MNAPAYWNEAKAHLSARDKIMRGLISAYEGEMLTMRGDAFYTLARSIAGQQISVKAADTVWKRLEGYLKEISPVGVYASTEEQLRSLGLSRSKVSYLQDIARHFIDNPKAESIWPGANDEEIIRELTALRGVGRWTAEMFLIFHLGRPDVLPLADIGLRKAVERHYNKGKAMPPARMEKLGESWRPYRSVATWYLWRALDPVPVAY